MDRRHNDRGLAAPAEPVRAAGGVLWRDEGGRIEVAIVHRPHRADWSLPKGKLDPGESCPEAALREVFEETGVRGRLGRGIGEVTYADQRSDPPRPKVVRYWAVEALEGRFEPRAEVDELRWLELDDALELLTYERDREVMARFSGGPPRVAMLLLIRHADALDAHRWSGDPRLRPASRQGAARAAALARMLIGFDVNVIVASTAARCVATVEPLAEAAGLRVIAEQELSEDGYRADPDAVAGRLSRLAVTGSAAVACTHAPVIADLLGRFGALAQPLQSTAPGGSWALSLNGGALVGAEYLPPPAAD